MKPGLQAGAVYEFSATVTDSMKATLEGGEIHPYYATTAMIAHMEWAARQHILPYLEPGEEGVGYHVDVRHLRPTPVGETVTIRSTVTEVTPRRVTSRVEAWNATGQIGEGQFTQAIVPVETLQARALDLAPPESQAEAQARKPAILAAADGQSSLTLWVEKRESPYACTRYDEWLTCRALLRAPGFQHNAHGAFLLRYELEEWAQAMLAGHFSATDFIEAPFQCHLHGDVLEVGVFPEVPPGEPAPRKPSHTLRWPLPPEALPAFAAQILAQLSRFPSML